MIRSDGSSGSLHLQTVLQSLGLHPHCAGRTASMLLFYGDWGFFLMMEEREVGIGSNVVKGKHGREQSHVHARKKLIHAKKKSMPKESQTAS